MLTLRIRYICPADEHALELAGCRDLRSIRTLEHTDLVGDDLLVVSSRSRILQ